MTYFHKKSLLGIGGVLASSITALATLALTACTALAAPVTITWDAQMPCVRFRVMLGIDMLADVATNSARIDLPDDRVSVITVQAYSMLGAAPMSEPLALQPLTVETGETLQKWTRVGTVFREVKEGETRQFFRVRFPN